MNEAPFALRLPDDLCEKIQTLAEREKRSRNQMIVLLLEEAMQQRKVDAKNAKRKRESKRT
jgi:hypothetical protein